MYISGVCWFRRLLLFLLSFQTIRHQDLLWCPKRRYVIFLTVHKHCIFESVIFLFTTSFKHCIFFFFNLQICVVDLYWLVWLSICPLFIILLLFKEPFPLIFNPVHFRLLSSPHYCMYCGCMLHMLLWSLATSAPCSWELEVECLQKKGTVQWWGNRLHCRHFGLYQRQNKPWRSKTMTW